MPSTSNSGTPTLLKIENTEAGPTVNISPPLGVFGYSRFNTTVSSPPANAPPVADSKDVKFASSAFPPLGLISTE